MMFEDYVYDHVYDLFSLEEENMSYFGSAGVKSKLFFVLNCFMF